MSIDTTINKKSETLEQYQKRLIKQGFYNSENDILNAFTKKNKKSEKSRFLPNWKLWQKALLIILSVALIIVIGIEMAFQSLGSSTFSKPVKI